MAKTLPEGIAIRDADDYPDARQLMLDLIEVDRLCYDRFEPEDTGPAEYWLQMDRYKFCQVASLGERVVGYAYFCRLSEDGAARIGRGELREGQMLDCLDRSNGKIINLYVASVVVLPEFRGRGIADALLGAASRGIRARGYEIAAVYATIWSESGARYWDKFAPVEIARDALNHPVVRMDAIAAL